MGNLIYKSMFHGGVLKANEHSEWVKYIHIFTPSCDFLLIYIDQLTVCTNSRKISGSDVISIFTIEDIENTSSGSRMYFHMHFTSVLFVFEFNTRVYRINCISTVSWSYLSLHATIWKIHGYRFSFMCFIKN